MRVYIATAFHNQKQFHELRVAIESLGHTITRDWTKDSVNYGDPGREEKFQKYAEDDYSSIMDADIVVVIATPPPIAGTFFEFGVAVKSGKDVILVDPFNQNNQENIFYHLRFPWIIRVKDLNEAAAMVDEISFTRRQEALAEASAV